MNTHASPDWALIEVSRMQREAIDNIRRKNMGKFNEQLLLYKYTHQGCPGQKMEDVCKHPSLCAELGGCRMTANGGYIDDTDSPSNEEVDAWLRHFNQRRG